MATLKDLHSVEGKAELIAGEIVRYPSGGHDPAQAAFRIAVSLHAHAKRTGIGEVFTGGLVYAIDPPLPGGRQSFSPDASYRVGPPPRTSRAFLEGPPTFAVEVREEHESGPAAEVLLTAKRREYFDAGTLVVWDVDTDAETVAVYRGDPATPDATYRLGQVAEAEPAVPGWRMPVDEVF